MAALIGLEFSLAVAARASESSEATCLKCVEHAERAALVDEIAVDRFRFTHALVRDALEGELSASRRARAARVDRSRDRTAATPTTCPSISAPSHTTSRKPVHRLHLQRALECARQSAERANGQLAFEVAADDLTFALEIADRLPDPSPELRYELLMEKGRDARHGRAAPARARGVRGRRERRAGSRRLGTASRRPPSPTKKPVGAPDCSVSTRSRCCARRSPMSSPSDIRIFVQSSLARADRVLRRLRDRAQIAGDALEQARATGDPSVICHAIVAYTESSPFDRPIDVELIFALSLEATELARRGRHPVSRRSHARAGGVRARRQSATSTKPTLGSIARRSIGDAQGLALRPLLDHEPRTDLRVLRRRPRRRRGRRERAVGVRSRTRRGHLRHARRTDVPHPARARPAPGAGARRTDGRCRRIRPAAMWRPGLISLLAEVGFIDDARALLNDFVEGSVRGTAARRDVRALRSACWPKSPPVWARSRSAATSSRCSRPGRRPRCGSARRWGSSDRPRVTSPCSPASTDAAPTPKRCSRARSTFTAASACRCGSRIRSPTAPRCHTRFGDRRARPAVRDRGAPAGGTPRTAQHHATTGCTRARMKDLRQTRRPTAIYRRADVLRVGSGSNIGGTNVDHESANSQVPASPSPTKPLPSGE